MQAQDIITKVQGILLDSSGDRWLDTELLGYLNMAIKQTIILKPDASTKTEAVQLVSGTRQSLPATGYQLIDVIRNMGADGNTPGRIVRLLRRQTLDNSDPDWHTTENAVVQHYTYDEREPRNFYVYPGQPATPSYVELGYSYFPAELTATTDSVPLGAEYEGCLLDYMLARAFMKDADNPSYQQRAITHINSFTQALGAQDKVEQINSPNIIERTIGA